MRNRLAIGISLSGWAILVTYLFYDYHAYDGNLLLHLFSLEPSEILFHILVFASPVGSTITGYLINERNKLLEQAKKSEKHLNSLLREWRETIDSLPYGVMLVDADFNIIRANSYI